MDKLKTENDINVISKEKNLCLRDSSLDIDSKFTNIFLFSLCFFSTLTELGCCQPVNFEQMWRQCEQWGKKIDEISLILIR